MSVVSVMERMLGMSGMGGMLVMSGMERMLVMSSMPIWMLGMLGKYAKNVGKKKGAVGKHVGRMVMKYEA